MAVVVMCVFGGALNWKEQHCSFQLSSRCEAGFRQTAHEGNVNDLSDLFHVSDWDPGLLSFFMVDHI